MKSFFSTIIFMTVCLMLANAQKPQPQLAQIDNEKMNQQLDSTMKAFDSLNQKINSYNTTMDSANRRLEDVSNNKNLEEFMNEQQAKEKSSAQRRYVIGLFLLVVLIYGIMRKRKKTE